MPRVVKDAEVRRRELLDAALSLFTAQGYDRTSIEQITDAVGVSKGNFYHYFGSKQDLLEALMDDWVETLFARISEDLEHTPGNALDRLRLLFRRGSEMKTERFDVTRAFGQSLYAEENLRLRYHLMSKWMARVSAMMAAIVADGARERVFVVDDPAGAADAVSSLWYGWSERHSAEVLAASSDPAELVAYAPTMRALETAMERILGVAPGALGLGLAEAVENLAAAAATVDQAPIEA